MDTWDSEVDRRATSTAAVCLGCSDVVRVFFSGDPDRAEPDHLDTRASPPMMTTPPATRDVGRSSDPMPSTLSMVIYECT